MASAPSNPYYCVVDRNQSRDCNTCFYHKQAEPPGPFTRLRCEINKKPVLEEFDCSQCLDNNLNNWTPCHD